MYQIAFDPTRLLLHLVLQNYWTTETFEAFAAEMRAHHNRIFRQHKSYLSLCDARQFLVQSAEISTEFEALFAAILAENHGRFAIIAASALNSLQAKRALPQPNVQLFTDENKALSWLLEKTS